MALASLEKDIDRSSLETISLHWSTEPQVPRLDSHNWSAMGAEEIRMGIAYVSRPTRALAPAALLLLTLSLAGCATSTGSPQMDARAEAPAPPKKTGYPRLEDQPQPREITSADELKLKKELTAARDRQAAAVKAREGAPQTIQPTNQAARQ